MKYKFMIIFVGIFLITLVGLFALASALNFKDIHLPRGEQPITVRINATACLTLERPQLKLTNTNDFILVKCDPRQHYETIESLIRQHNAIENKTRE